MTRADQGIVGPCGHFGQAGVHLCGRALEQPATAERHQAVGGKGCVGGRGMERDMADCMARDVDHIDPCRAKGEAVAITECYIERWQALGIGGGAMHGGRKRCGQLGQALYVVGVVMCQPYLAQSPAALLQRRRDGGRFGNVDQGYIAGLFVAQQKGVIV